MGRTNKLVDGCYSFWQGALFPLLQRLGPQLLAQTSVPMQPASVFAATSVASPSRADVGSKAVGSSREGSTMTASPSDTQSCSGAAGSNGGTVADEADQPNGRRICVPPLPDILACGPAAAARAQAAALKATADAAVQAALAAQLSAVSAGGFADDGAAPGPASGRQRRELASERVRQLADTAGAALEVRLHVRVLPNLMLTLTVTLVVERSGVLLWKDPRKAACGEDVHSNQLSGAKMQCCWLPVIWGAVWDQSWLLRCLNRAMLA